jgi:hypothetical protein
MNTPYMPGELILAYREKSKLWEGPYAVVVQEGKIITIKLNDETAPQRFNIASTKRYVLPEKQIAAISSEPTATPITDTEHTSNVSIETEEESLVHRVMITEILSPGDPRDNSPDFYKAKLAELQGLKDNGTWEEVWEKDIPRARTKCAVGSF